MLDSVGYLLHRHVAGVLCRVFSIWGKNCSPLTSRAQARADGDFVQACVLRTDRLYQMAHNAECVAVELSVEAGVD